MKRYGMLLAAGLFVAGGANAALDNKAAEELMKGDASAAAKLADKVKKGGVGVWGQIPMPPNPQVSDADIKNLVAWILTLKK
jgi:cytochrome c551/c552